MALGWREVVSLLEVAITCSEPDMGIGLRNNFDGFLGQSFYLFVSVRHLGG